MTGIGRLLSTTLVAAALLFGDMGRVSLAPAPAFARDRDECYYDRRGVYRCDDDDRLSASDILIGAAVLAGVIAVIASATRDRDDNRYDRRSYDREAAIGVCSDAAIREAQRYGRGYARVRDIDDVDRDGSRYQVRGEVEIDSGRYYGTTRARFRCTAQYGRVTAFRFTDGFDYAAIR